MYVFIFLLILVTEWLPIVKIAAHSALTIRFLSISVYFFILFFPPRFLQWEFLSDCIISRSLPTFTFLYRRHHMNALLELNNIYSAPKVT